MQYSLANLLKKYKISAQKHWGQNWLANENIISQIVNVIDLHNKEIVEIGPGLGALTFSLIKIVKSIIAYELDPIAIKILKTEIPTKNLEIYHQDFLQANFKWESKKILIGNIPYYITSEILFKIIENNCFFSHVLLTVQNEVANRLTASVGSKEYGKLTVTINLFAEVKKHFVIKAQEFYPIPKVDSALIVLTLKKDINFSDSKYFLIFIKKCFAFQRKTLFNNLKAFIKNHDKILQTFKTMSLNLNVRPQQLNTNQFINLYQFLDSPQL